MAEKAPVHYVSTLDEAHSLIQNKKDFWVSNCGCRESNKNGCKRSRIDVCLLFINGESSGSGLHKISKKDAMAILKEATNKALVSRPFRDKTHTQIEGICFCCDDCCGYFQDPTEVCDKGKFSEATNFDECTHCGACVLVCYFNARKMVSDHLIINQNNCYGCGLCVNACPTKSIKMVLRKKEK